MNILKSLCTTTLGALVLFAASHGAVADTSGKDDASVAEGKHALRSFDCARCHGPDYKGLVGPSLIAYVKANSEEQFSRAVLEGNPVRGMPPYKSQKGVVDNVGKMYAYLKQAAEGGAEKSGAVK